MGDRLRVIVDGSDAYKVNKIVVKTFLDGLLYEYKKDLSIAFRGKGYVSSIAEEWCDKHFPATGGRNVFNAEWLYKDFLATDLEDFGHFFVEDYKPDLIFLFNSTSIDYVRAARSSGVPLYKVEKDI